MVSGSACDSGSGRRMLRVVVEGLSTIPVGSFHDIQLRIKEGDRQRTIAATKMNETSRQVVCMLVTERDQQASRVHAGD